MDISNICTLASTTLLDDLLYFPWGRMALIGLILYLILCFYAWIFADRILFPAPGQPGYENDESVLLLESANGGKIACKHWVAPAPKGLTILYSHGNAEDLGRVEDFILGWVADGWSVFAYDYPGYGHSPGKPSEQGCYHAIDTAFQHLTSELNIPKEKIVIWGRSLGSGPSCYLAEKERVGGLILETPFITAYRTVTETPVLPWDRFRNIHRAPNIQNKSLVIHGHEDEIVPFRHGKKLFYALPEPKQFLEFRNSGHNDLPETGGEKYRTGITDFLNQVLGG